MLHSQPFLVLCAFVTLAAVVSGESKFDARSHSYANSSNRRVHRSLEACQDYAADQNNCTKFTRCFHNLRIIFTCPSGSAWEDSLKTCVHSNHVDACKLVHQEKRKLGKSFVGRMPCPSKIYVRSVRVYVATPDDIVTYEADVDALINMTIGETVAQGRSLGPMVTPKQFSCSFCRSGSCGVVQNTFQCTCGNTVCPSAQAAPGKTRSRFSR